MIITTTYIEGAYDVDSNGCFRRLGKCTLYDFKNYREAVKIDLRTYKNSKFFYDPTSRDLHKYKQLKGKQKDDVVYGSTYRYKEGIFYDQLLKEAVKYQGGVFGEAIIENVDYVVSFFPYQCINFERIEWIDESEGSFYYKPLKDGDAFKYAAIEIDDQDEELPFFYFYFVKKYVEKVEDVGECYATYDINSYGYYNIRKFKLLRSEITDIELFKVPIIVKKTCNTSELRLHEKNRLETYVYYDFSGENNVKFQALVPNNVIGGTEVKFSATEEGEHIVEYDCSYSDYQTLKPDVSFSLEFKSTR